MRKRRTRQERIASVLLALYLILLTWVIVFKFSFSLKEMDRYRSVNLIPLAGSAWVHGHLIWNEIVSNIWVFIPFGVYLSIVMPKWGFLKKASCIAGVSLTYEVVQFILKIGASDITDLIGNTLGGVIGIIIWFVLHKILKSKTNIVINTLGLIVAVGGIAFLTILIICNQ